MNVKYLAVGSVVAAIILFAWGGISHALLKWHEATMETFAEDNTVVETVRSQVTGNGIYYSRKGLLVSVFYPPDFGDVKITPRQLGVQAGLCFGVGLLLALLVGLLASRSAGVAALATGTAGVAAVVIVHMSNWNWYSVPLAHVAVLSADIVVGWLLAGLALGFLRSKLEE